MKKINPSEYQRMTDRASPPSNHLKNVAAAYLVGGLICTLGQGLLNLYGAFGLSPELAASCTSVSLIFLSALLTGLKVYDKIAQFAGAGTLVPITGFANAVVSPALEFKSEGLILGLAARMFVIAGPVLVWGTAAASLYGLIFYLMIRF